VARTSYINMIRRCRLSFDKNCTRHQHAW